MNDAQDHEARAEADFAERMAKVRSRFVAKLSGKIAEVTDALPRMTGVGSDAVGAVTLAYREVHDICGIAPTIGFAATGQLARQCDAVLVTPFRDQRSLSANELALLTEKIEALRIGALTEMQSPPLEPELNR
jgi:hypothetical protein